MVGLFCWIPIKSLLWATYLLRELLESLTDKERTVIHRKTVAEDKRVIKKLSVNYNYRIGNDVRYWAITRVWRISIELTGFDTGSGHKQKSGMGNAYDSFWRSSTSRREWLSVILRIYQKLSMILRAEASSSDSQKDDAIQPQWKGLRHTIRMYSYKGQVSISPNKDGNSPLGLSFTTHPVNTTHLIGGSLIIPLSTSNY